MTAFRLLLLAGTALAIAPAAAFAQTASPETAAPAQTPAPARPSASAPSSGPSSVPSQTATPQTADPAQAEPVADPETEDQSSAVEDVVVTGQANGIRASIDATSYSLADDLQATTGTLADALRNVPSVDVDPQGSVSLRGDSNVTILVDGRPSAILSGPNRGDVILQLPADRYARIEVMTNPSAAYSPEGSGGVINLITKPTPAAVAGAPGAPAPVTRTATLRANVGDNGRYNVGAGGAYQSGKLTLTGDANYRYDTQPFVLDRRRERLDPTTGAVVATTTTDLSSDTTSEGIFGRLAAEYAASARTQLTGELRYQSFSSEGPYESRFETSNAAGSVTALYDRDGQNAFSFGGWGATARLLQKFDDSGHEWSTELRFDRNDNDGRTRTLNLFTLPVTPGFFEAFESDGGQDTIGLTSAYVRPWEDGSRLRAGYELKIERPDQSSRLSRGPTEVTLVVVPSLTNDFEATQTVHALYATYERPFGEKFSAQAGLRLEQAEVEIEDLTNAVAASQDYFRAYPTAHLQYKLNDTQTLRASYSKRIQRPQPTQLNPFVSYGDPLNLRSGNPDLEPQETDSVELQWQMREGQSFYQLTGYYRDTTGAFTDVATDLGGNVFLTRPENLGGRTDLGVELTASGRLHPTLRYNASINAFRQEIDAGGLPGARDREGELVSGRASLNWQATAKDFVQVSAFWQGDQLLAQGIRESGGMLNIGYRRKLNDALSLQITGRDVLNSFGGATVYDTPLFKERTEQDIRLRAFYIGLTWTLGGGPRRQPEQFDFSSGGGPAGG